MDASNPNAASPTGTEIHTLGCDQLADWAFHGAGHRAQHELPRLNEVFAEILWTANEYIPSLGGSICLCGLPGSENELVFVAVFGEGSEAITGSVLPMAKGITGRVFREGIAARINDPHNDPDFYPDIDRKLRYTSRSILATPIRFDGKSVGVITLVNRLEEEGFSSADARFLNLLCDYASNSLRNLADALHHREIAQRDSLTGLRNDRFFLQQMRKELETRERLNNDLSLLFIDLDRFKRIVDTHGHLVGSQVLAEVGQLIAKVVTDPTATLARYGGDEFVVILPGSNSEKAAETAESIRQSIADTVFLSELGPDGRPALHLKREFSASIGVASYRDCGFSRGTPTDWKTRQRDFIHIADNAMYEAKRQGKDRVCVGP